MIIQSAADVRIKTDTVLSSIYSFHSTLNYDELKQDIKINGINVPLEIAEDGIIIDGHRRFLICQELGIPLSEIPVHIGQYESEDDKIEAAINYNLLRRQLDLVSRAYIATKYILPKEKKKAKERMLSGRRDPSINSNEGGRAYALAATKVWISEDTLRKAERTFKYGTQELITLLLNGDISLNKAHNKVKKQEQLKRNSSKELYEEYTKKTINKTKAIMISSLPKNIQRDVIKKVKEKQLSDKETERLINAIEREPGKTDYVLSLPKNELTPLPEDFLKFNEQKKPEQLFFEEGACPNCGASYVLDRVNNEINWRNSTNGHPRQE